MVITDAEYQRALQSTTIRKVKPNKKSAAKQRAMGQSVSDIKIAPLNTQIDFSKLKVKGATTLKGAAAITAETLPLNWSWRSCSDIHPVQTQLLCGSCWAFSTAAAVSDSFVIGLSDIGYTPEISPTYMMANCPNAGVGCNGGNPGTALQCMAGTAIGNTEGPGVSDNHCIDYSWCVYNDYCNGTKSAAATELQANTDLIESSRPTQAGACWYSGTYPLYKIENPESWGIDAYPLDGEQMWTESNWDQGEKLLKMHFLYKGSGIAGFFVFNNFMSGTWADPNSETKGIYLECWDYDNNGNARWNGTPSTQDYAGGHAVRIIGWGETTVPMDPQSNSRTPTKVKFWECVNSWGPNWGDDGYFRMAMYPFNKVAQFDKVVTLDNGARLGGIVTLEPTKVVQTPLEAYNGTGNEQLIHDKSWYTSKPDKSSRFMTSDNCDPQLTAGDVKPDDVPTDDKPTDDVPTKSPTMSQVNKPPTKSPTMSQVNKPPTRSQVNKPTKSQVNKPTKSQVNKPTKSQVNEPTNSYSGSREEWCREIQDTYNVIPGVTWGSMPKRFQQRWFDYDCPSYVKTSPLPNWEWWTIMAAGILSAFAFFMGGGFYAKKGKETNPKRKKQVGVGMMISLGILIFLGAVVVLPVCYNTISV